MEIGASSNALLQLVEVYMLIVIAPINREGVANAETSTKEMK